MGIDGIITTDYTPSRELWSQGKKTTNPLTNYILTQLPLEIPLKELTSLAAE
jgi:hypothetical protein